jgi:hypothetical protein
MQKALFSNYGTATEYLPVAPLPGTRRHCGEEFSNITGHGACFTKANFSKTPLFGAYDRNQFTGPDYFDTDMTLTKNFDLPYGVKFEAGVTAYNLFNHPSFQNPVSNINSSLAGKSLSAVSAPTSSYGAGYGDTTMRMVQVTGKISF